MQKMSSWGSKTKEKMIFERNAFSKNLIGWEMFVSKTDKL